MRSLQPFLTLPLAIFCLLATASAQQHDTGSSPPTAPPPKPVVAPQIAPVSSGLGALEFSPVIYAVSAPQALALELQSSDPRSRTAALAALGAPAAYLNHDHVPLPHSVHLDFLALGNTGELDAILTAELDQHLVSAILMPQEGEWRHLATVSYPTAFSDPSTTPSTFLRADRSLLDHRHYVAIFHATINGADGYYAANEAHLGIYNGHAVITLSFASTERTCDPAHLHLCDLTERWLQPDSTDPTHRFLLVTATGHMKPDDPTDPIARAQTFEAAQLRSFSCQPFVFSDTSLHFEPTASPTPCITPHDTPPTSPHDTQHDTQHEQPLH